MQPKANMTVSHKLGHRRGYSLTDFRRTMPPPPSVVFFDHRQHATAADGPSQNPGLPQRSQSSLGHRRGSSWTPIPTSTSTPPPRPTYSSSNHMIIAGDLFNGGVDPMHHRQPLSLNLNFSAFGNDLSMETLSSGKKK